jgi:hypothetical protein
VLAKSVDLGAPKAARDQRILDLRRVIAAALPLALTAAGMPAKMPGITDVPQAGDDLSSF